MLVKDWMSKDVVTVEVNDYMAGAAHLMKKNKIRRLPVVKKGKLVGILTDRDLKQASASSSTSLEIHELLYIINKIKIEKIMTKDPITVTPDHTVDEAAQIMIENKISGLPVVDERGGLVGIITQTDVFKVLVSLSGLHKKGVSFGFMLEDRSGSIKEVADIIRQYGGRMASILSSYEGAPEGHRNVYIRVYGIDRSRLEYLIDELREKPNFLYMVDHRESSREII